MYISDILFNSYYFLNNNYSFCLIELPWDQPSTGCPEYVKWKSNERWTTATPWSKIDTLALSFLRKILEPQASKRILLEKIMDHKWCHLQFHSSAGMLFVHEQNISIGICIWIFVFFLQSLLHALSDERRNSIQMIIPSFSVRY